MRTGGEVEGIHTCDSKQATGNEDAGSPERPHAWPPPMGRPGSPLERDLWVPHAGALMNERMTERRGRNMPSEKTRSVCPCTSQLRSSEVRSSSMVGARAPRVTRISDIGVEPKTRRPVLHTWPRSAAPARNCDVRGSSSAVRQRCHLRQQEASAGAVGYRASAARRAQPGRAHAAFAGPDLAAIPPGITSVGCPSTPY